SACWPGQSTNEFGRHVYASLGLARPAAPDMYGYISELHGYGMPAEASGEQAEDLAATMLASTLGLDFDPEGDDMDCCGHALTRRNWMWGTILTSVGAMLGGGVGPRGSTAAAETAATASAALDVLRKSISVDVHTHGGTTGITSKAPPSDDLANGMRTGSLAVACLADVPDGPILGRNAAGVLTALRTPEPGLLYKHHLERLVWVDQMVANHGLRRALTAADLEAAHAAGQPAIVVDIEGL